MELSQSSTSTKYSRFPEACLKRRNSCALKFFGVLHLVLSTRKLSCEQFYSSINFYNAFIQRRLMHNDGLDFSLPKFVSALRTSKFSLLHFAQVVNEFDDSPSSITSASLALLSRQIVHLPWQRKCLSSCTSVNIPHNFFRFISFCYESGFCTRVLSRAQSAV